ncbi:hypothetical protein H4217_004324 [Coemansia sp. RSA 1939]|nr:hypothetical protein H4217_004324 [Coemansia sp. RSA 1939]KAJ2600100.1 hypothetical protein EV177_007199 [Coemansia sp. RSA 1804]KAJ2685602.1 hypothetical protein GGH99_003720 [Coemansia sp. RSA 1285]
MAMLRIFVAARPSPHAYRSFSTTHARLAPGLYPYPLVRLSQPAQMPPGTHTQPTTQGGGSGDLPVGLAFGRDDKAASTQGAKINSSSSSNIIGWLKRKNDPITPEHFIENSEFWPVVVKVLEKHAHEDPELKAQAVFQKDGWINIADRRNPPPLGRTGDPDDIFGFVLVMKKVIQPETFQSNIVHRPVTRDGLFQLPKYLHGKLLDALAQR